MEQFKRIKMSISRPGMSDIQIEFKDKYRAEDFPDISPMEPARIPGL